MTTLESASQKIMSMASELSDAMGYTQSDTAWFPGATIIYADPNEPKRKARPRHKWVTDQAHRLIVVQPRALFISHEQYLCWIHVTSDYETWMVYTEGRPEQLERTIMTLWVKEDSEWKNIRSPWMEDVKNRQSMTRPKWGESTGSIHTDWNPSKDEDTPDTSTQTTFRKRLTFGDLSSLEKRTRRSR